MILRTLHHEAKRLVTPELASGELERWPESAYASLLGELPREVDLEHFDEVLDHVTGSAKRFAIRIDPLSAPGIHRALPLTRREASRADLWRFLTVVHRPDFVRYRWKNRAFGTMRARFWSMGTGPEGNTFARLWWIAELTRQGKDYSLTERVLSKQALATQLFSGELGWHRPVVAAAAKVLSSASADVVAATMVELTKTLSAVVVESQREPALANLLTTLRQRVERRA